MKNRVSQQSSDQDTFHKISSLQAKTALTWKYILKINQFPNSLRMIIEKNKEKVAPRLGRAAIPIRA